MTDYNDTISETISSTSSPTSLLEAYSTIAETVFGFDWGKISPISQLIQENLNFVDSTLSDYLLTLSEKIIVSSQEGDIIEANELLEEYFNLIDSIYVIYSNEVSETVGLSSTITGLIYQVTEVIEYFKSVNNITTLSEFYTPVVELISILNIIDYGIPQSITEAIVIDNLITTLHTALNSILESSSINNTVSDSYINIISLSESIINSSTATSTATLIESLVDDFIITIGKVGGQDSYLAYLFQPETSFTTTYSNYNFDGGTSAFNKYLFFNSTGLYEYGGSTDDGEKIVSDIQTAALSFGTSNLKSCPTLYLGYSSDGTTYLKVKVDGRADVTYKLNKRSHNLGTKKVDIGKGLVGRYFQYELISDSDLTIESIDLLPIVIKRKL